jgi:hypothetical protein
MSEPKTYEGLMRHMLDNDWGAVRCVKAIYGFTMREHVNEAHPDQVQRVAEMATEPMAPEDRDAWLFGYRYHDAPPVAESETLCPKT